MLQSGARRLKRRALIATNVAHVLDTAFRWPAIDAVNRDQFRDPTLLHSGELLQLL